MNNFQHIQEKLQGFIRKYYLNELIKGTILFLSIGVLYFILTVFVESFLWLKPTVRTALFWLFILVEFLLILKFILFPIFKLIGLKKGISNEEASHLIGKHFSKVDDKLLNILQLENHPNKTELLLASIEQKSAQLQPIPFKKAVNFNTNTKYLKYVVIPVVLILVILFSDLKTSFSSGYKRVVQHNTNFEKPAPFSFVIKNKNLQVIEGTSITIEFASVGSVVPLDAQIHFLGQQFYAKNLGNGNFEYTFTSVLDSFDFFISSGEVSSQLFKVELLFTPLISDFQIQLSYPSYTKKTNETIENTGNIQIPAGTKIKWELQTINTDSILYTTNAKRSFFEKADNTFFYNETALKSFNYSISTSNSYLKNYENINYFVDVIPDAYPTIDIKSNIDSVKFGSSIFLGQVTDDHGLTSLKLKYFDATNSEEIKELELEIEKTDFQQFQYIFPNGLQLEEGVSYDFYFEVYDNDAVNGIKSTKSNTFSYYNKTANEIEEQLLLDQKNSIEQVEKTLENNRKTQEEISKANESLQNKSEMNWNDQRNLQNYLERQKMYDQMMEQQTEELQQNLNQQENTNNEFLNQKKQDIQQRLQEAQELSKQEEQLKELEKLAEKLNKEGLTDKLKQLAEKNRQKERNLERILELTKRYYVEQKANQISEKLEQLAEEQKVLSEIEENSSNAQEELNEQFNQIQEELKQLEKDNKDLKRPMKLADTKSDEQKIDEQLNKAKEQLENSENESIEDSQQQESKKSAQKNQKSAAQKMKQMSQKMQESMMSMQGETMDEDIEMLRAILENLLTFSFEQEELMKEFTQLDTEHPDFSNKLKQQQSLREYFEHIDDSLYTLSMRQPKIGTDIFKDLSDVHYHLAESLDHFADNQFNVAQSDQQFVMTSTNNIAYLLSNILNSMQNASPSMGQGQGDSFGLPDIIQKQEDAIEQMQNGMQKGKEQGEQKGNEGQNSGEEGNKSSGSEDQMSGEIYEIYKQQAQLRSMLEEALKDKNIGNGASEDILNKMEQLEQDLLEKGYSNDVLQQMQQLKHELLKLQEAAYEQGIDTQRKSNTNYKEHNTNYIEQIDDEKLWFNENELLNRQSLPLKPHYKKRVQEYFKANDSIQ